MSREHPRDEAWAEFYRNNPHVLADWRENNGLPPRNDEVDA